MIRISSTGIKGLAEFVARTPEVAREAAKLAVGDTAEWGRNLAKREMKAAVNLPEDALAARRFRIAQRPTNAHPEAVLSADNNPLGLSRFVVGQKAKGTPHPKVRILVGGATKSFSSPDRKGTYSFLIPTPGGADGVGLAVRTKRPLQKSQAARKIGPDLYLLSGPSVNQMFGQMIPALVPRIEAKMQTEFARQYERLIRG